MPSQVIYKVIVVKLRNVSGDDLCIFYEVEVTVLRYRVRVMKNSETFNNNYY